METANVTAVIAAANSGAEFSVEHLTVSERWEVARRLGWAAKFSHAYLSEWCGGPAVAPRKAGPDYEAKILAAQERCSSTWG